MELPDIFKRSSPVIRSKWPAGFGVGLHLVEGVWGGTGEELAEEEATLREDGAADGEANRSPGSILYEAVLSSVSSLLCTLSLKSRVFL